MKIKSGSIMKYSNGNLVTVIKDNTPDRTHIKVKDNTGYIYNEYKDYLKPIKSKGVR